MNFEWTEAEQEIKPKLAALFDEDSVLELEALERADLSELKNTTSRYLGRLAEIGYLAIGVGPGGRERTLAMVAAQEDLALASGSLFLAVEASARLFGGLLAGFGDPESIRDVAEPLAKGEIIGAVALSEAEKAEAPAGSVTSALPDGGEYVVTGRKSYVTNGPIADWIAVSGEIQGRPAIFLVEPGLPGVTMGPRFETLGYKGLAVSSLALNEVRIPRARVLGPFDDDAGPARLRVIQDLVLTVASVGLSRRTTAEAKDYAQSHQRGGRPVFKYQEVRFKIAEMLTWTQSAQLLLYRAGWHYSVNHPEAETVLQCAKVYCAEAAEQVATLAMQVMAGRGYISGNPVERAYREAKFAGVAGTTSEVARMAVADEMLRKHPV